MSTDWSQVPAQYAKRREARAAEFHQDGSPTLPARGSPETLGSILERLPPDSSTSGSPSPVPAGARQIGQPPGATGAVAKPIDWAALETVWHQQDPDQLEKLLYRSLKPYSRSLRPIVSASFDLLGYERVGELDNSTRMMLRDMAQRINEPAGREAVARAAGRCLQLTKSREQDSADLRLMMEAFCDELAEFPADAVVYAFRQWARREKWWPSLSEIRSECQRVTTWRRSLLQAVAA